MEGTGIIVWLVVSVVLATAVSVAAMQLHNPGVSQVGRYVLPAALLGTYMGSQSFTWLSAKGPEVGGYYLLTSLVFGVVLAWLAAMAAVAEPVPADTSEDM